MASTTPETGFISDRQLSKRWGLSMATLRHKRSTGKIGIPFFKLDGVVRYALEDILEYESRNRISF